MSLSPLPHMPATLKETPVPLLAHSPDPPNLPPPSPPLQPSVALPLAVRKRKTYLETSVPRISDDSAAMMEFDKLVSESETPEAALLILIQRYNIDLNVLMNIGGEIH